MYWKIFLKTDDRYKGVLWKNSYDFRYYAVAREIVVGDITAKKNTDSTYYKVNSSDIPYFNTVSIIQVRIDDEYYSSNDAKIIVSISELNGHHNYYWFDHYLIRFSQSYFNEWQTGLLNFEIVPIKDPVEKVIAFEVKSGNQNNVLKNVRIIFYRL